MMALLFTLTLLNFLGLLGLGYIFWRLHAAIGALHEVVQALTVTMDEMVVSQMGSPLDESAPQASVPDAASEDIPIGTYKGAVTW